MRHRAAALLLPIAAACAGARDGSPARAREAPPTVEERIGAELFELVDRAVEFQGARRRATLARLSDLGIDSLTPATVRRLRLENGRPIITVELRAADGGIRSCEAGPDILEEASLNEDRFTMQCTSPDGGVTSRTVRRLPRS